MKREYFFVKEAAEKSGCSVRDLIHFGGTGKLDIYMLQPLCYPSIIFEDDNEHPNGFRIIDPNGNEKEMYELPLYGPQLITQKGLKEFERSPSTASKIFDWNKAAKIEKKDKWRWYVPDPIGVLDQSQMVIMAPDLAELCEKFNLNNDVETGMRGAQEAHEDEKLMETSQDTVEVESMQPKGLTTPAIAVAFDGVNNWNCEDWKSKLADPPDWLVVAQLFPGRKGKGGAAIWDPVIIACSLEDKMKISVMILNNVFRDNPSLHPWADKWHETQSPFKKASK